MMTASEASATNPPGMRMCKGLPGRASSWSYSTTSCVFALTCLARYCDSGMRPTFQYYLRKSPGKGLRCFAAGTGPDLIQFCQVSLTKFYLKCAQAARQLIYGTRTDDRRGHHRVRQQPCQGNIRWFLALLLAEFFILVQLGCIFLCFLLNAFFRAPPCFLLAERSS